MSQYFHLSLKRWIGFAVLFAALAAAKASPPTLAIHDDSITVYVFLQEDCVISQYYTLTLRELHERYADSQIQFLGVFSSLASHPEAMQAFKDKYEVPFAFKTDFYHVRKQRFGVTVTPEVVVYNETRSVILYQGRIDNTYTRVGKRRNVTTTAELRDALEAIRTHRAIEVPRTQPVGCFISKRKLNHY